MIIEISRADSRITVYVPDVTFSGTLTSWLPARRLKSSTSTIEGDAAR